MEMLSRAIKFYGKDPVPIQNFLAQLKSACDWIGVFGGIALRIMPSYIKDGKEGSLAV